MIKIVTNHWFKLQTQTSTSRDLSAHGPQIYSQETHPGQYRIPNLSPLHGPLSSHTPTPLSYCLQILPSRFCLLLFWWKSPCFRLNWTVIWSTGWNLHDLCRLYALYSMIQRIDLGGLVFPPSFEGSFGRLS